MIARNVNVNLFRQVRMWALFGSKCAVSRPRTTSVFVVFPCCLNAVRLIVQLSVSTTTLMLV